MKKSLDLCSSSRFQLKKCSRGRRLQEDRISFLPDEILMVIMSLLPFKDVVKTSILSCRWLNLWLHTPVLHFHALVPKTPLTSDGECQNYVEWVNRVLQRHQGQYLKEFKIVCELDGRNQEDIDKWLVFALARKVECLELNLLIAGHDTGNLDYKNGFPGPFLNFGSGKANSDGGESQFLQSDLKCLKSLSLKRVNVTGEAINSVLLNCPFLEQLEVVGSSTLVDLVISDPTLVLKYLKIKSNRNLKVLSISNFNLLSLDISTVGDLTLTNLPMLVELFIIGAHDRLSYCISQASSFFSQLEAVTLSGIYLKDATQLSNYGQLTKLKRLVINIGAWDHDLTKLISILNACPRLEEFVFKLSRGMPERISIPMNDVKRGSSSLKSQSLKVFEFVGYCGRVIDVELIMHVVENAVGLEKVVIRSIFPCNNGEMARRIASEHFYSLREAIPPQVQLIFKT